MKENVSRWREGLSRTSKARFGQIATVFGATEIDAETWDDLEALMIQADIGIDTTNEIINALQHIVAKEGIRKTTDLQKLVKEQLQEHLSVQWCYSRLRLAVQLDDRNLLRLQIKQKNL